MLGQPIVSAQTLSGLGRRKAEPLARAGEGGPLQEGQGQRCRGDLLLSVAGDWGDSGGLQAGGGAGRGRCLPLLRGPHLLLKETRTPPCPSHPRG